MPFWASPTHLKPKASGGHFVFADHVCKFLMDHKHYDVIEAMRHHIIGTQTLYHSFHPNLTEMTDLEDYDEAYNLALAEESECAGMIKVVLGVDSLTISDWPGNGASYVADNVMTDMGVLFHSDSGAFEVPVPVILCGFHLHGFMQKIRRLFLKFTVHIFTCESPQNLSYSPHFFGGSIVMIGVASAREEQLLRA